MLTYRQLAYFVAVAQERHFSRAADKLGIAQSAVSVQIQQLEQAVGVRLLNRNKRQPMTLTDAGELLYVEAQATLRHMARAQHVGLLAAQGLRGHVRIGYIGSAITTGVLTALLQHFRRSHARVHIELIAMETPRQLQALEAQEIDMALFRPRRRYTPALEVAIVHQEPLLVAMPDEHPLAQQRALRPHALRDQTFIAPQFNESEGFSELLARLAAQAQFPLKATYRVSDFMEAISLAGAGYGIVVLPASSAQFKLQGMRYLPFEGFDEQVQLAMAWRRRESAPACRALIAAAHHALQVQTPPFCP